MIWCWLRPAPVHAWHVVYTWAMLPQRHSFVHYFNKHSPCLPCTRGIDLNLSLLFKFQMVRTLAAQVLHSTKDKSPRLSKPGSELSSLFSYWVLSLPLLSCWSLDKKLSFPTLWCVKQGPHSQKRVSQGFARKYMSFSAELHLSWCLSSLSHPGALFTAKCRWTWIT